MAKGSFNGLYTFDEIGKIYKMDSSNLRKMVQHNKFIEGKEIKKFGKTWLITEEAVRKHFGNNIDIYFRNLKLQELEKLREEKIKKKLQKEASKKAKIKAKALNNDLGSDEEEDRGELGYIEVDPGSVISSFNFGEK